VKTKPKIKNTKIQKRRKKLLKIKIAQKKNSFLCKKIKTRKTVDQE
jgi:hypothetical protein